MTLKIREPWLRQADEQSSKWVLRNFRNYEDGASIFHYASKAVERVEKALDCCRVGPAAGLRAALDSFNRRRRDEVFCSKL